MDDFLALETLPSVAPWIVHPHLQHITTPLRAEAWQTHLASHPDQDFAQYLVRGIQQGFSIGIQRNTSCRWAKRNLRSAYEHPEVIDASFARETNLHQVIRLPPRIVHSLPSLQMSPISVQCPT